MVETTRTVHREEISKTALHREEITKTALHHQEITRTAHRRKETSKRTARIKIEEAMLHSRTTHKLDKTVEVMGGMILQTNQVTMDHLVVTKGKQIKLVKVTRTHKSTETSRKDKQAILGLLALQHLEIMVNRLHLELTGNRLDLQLLGNRLDLELTGNQLHQQILELTKGVQVMVEITDKGQDLHMEEITCKGVLVSILAQMKDKGIGRVGSKGLMRASPKDKAVVALLEM